MLGPADGDDDVADEALEEGWFGFRFRIVTDADAAARHRAELAELVERRNHMVHHFLPRWEAAVAGDSDAVLAWLDAQREAAVCMLDRLQQWTRAWRLAAESHSALMASAEGQRHTEMALLRTSRLVTMLGQVAQRTPRADGWTLLSSAGNLIQRDAPDELNDLRGRFGHATLKAILLATELFDVDAEAIAGGGTRTIYRINERWRLETSADAGS